MLTSFKHTLNPTIWSEVLASNTDLFFKIISGTKVELYFAVQTSPPAVADEGITIREVNGEVFDYEGIGFQPGQGIWARGDAAIKGVRG